MDSIAKLISWKKYILWNTTKIIIGYLESIDDNILFE